jgi:hypothetical protein
MSVIPGLGTLLKATITSVLTTVAQRVSIDGPEMSVGTAETTNLDSTWKTFRPTLPDGGTLSGTLQYDPKDASHAFLFTLISSPSQTGNVMNLVFKDGTIAAFTGILTKLKPTGMEVEGNLEAEFEIKVTGAIVITPGT